MCTHARRPLSRAHFAVVPLNSSKQRSRPLALPHKTGAHFPRFQSSSWFASSRGQPNQLCCMTQGDNISLLYSNIADNFTRSLSRNLIHFHQPTISATNITIQFNAVETIAFAGKDFIGYSFDGIPPKAIVSQAHAIAKIQKKNAAFPNCSTEFFLYHNVFGLQISRSGVKEPDSLNLCQLTQRLATQWASVTYKSRRISDPCPMNWHRRTSALGVICAR